MFANLDLRTQVSKDVHRFILLSDLKALDGLIPNQEQRTYVLEKMEDETALVTLQELPFLSFFGRTNGKGLNNNTAEAHRRLGHELFKTIEKENISEIELQGSKEILEIAEGLALSAYSFERHLSNPKHKEYNIRLVSEELSQENVEQLKNLCEAVYKTRDLVNEPVNHLDAEQLAQQFELMGQEAGFNVNILDEVQIESLKMGGLLAVNQGSPLPPTFSILEYKPENAINEKPYVFVGKGVVYDTGGLSLKPTPSSMDMMKCDMGGGATVGGLLYAVAKNKLPLHVIGLVPATDNRPGGVAFAPGDVITMYNGSTVEVLNTDAEGRLILADALAFAKKYDPELVIDLATLTGAAMRAIGKEAAVMMGTAQETTKAALKTAGTDTYERLVEFPFWDEYAEQLKSDIADLKNLGGATAGAITAGKFLEHFVDYEWLHIDIAGPAFIAGGEDNYRGKNGTGMGVRLLHQFLWTEYARLKTT